LEMLQPAARTLLQPNCT